MDIVLEVLDTFVFDRIYAGLVPATPGANFLETWKHGANTTLSSFGNSSSVYLNNYQFHPASQYFSVQPSKWAYMTRMQRDDPIRQLISLYFITWIFGMIVYFVFGTLSYVFVFDHETFKHPKYLKNQVALEMRQANWSMPIMALFTAPCFWLEVRGYSKIYDTTEEGPGLWYNFLQFPFFILFTDCFIYWIHRGLHHPWVYKRLHKPHHKWIMPTPFASHAFNPIDGFSQSVPYHVYPFLFPLQKFAYIFLFLFINIWTIMIHDGEYMTNSPIVNGAACHSAHHLYFNFNYGQFTTLWDRLGGSYRQPNKELFDKQLKMSKEEWDRQTKEMEKFVKEVEGEDDRDYLPDADSKKTQ